jgi:hypothetical protein
MIKEQQTTVESSTIRKYIYNFMTNSLKVEFNSGAIYEYNNVSPDVYESLCKAESQGKFFNEKIKHSFDYTKLLID